MNTKIMAHVTAGSRDGWGTAAPFLRGSLSFMADAFLEMSMSAFRIWRHQGYDWQGNVNLDIMPGFDDLTIDDMPAQAAYWWPIIQAQAVAEEDRLGIKFDAIKVTNEVGGGGDLPDTDYALQKLVAYEQAILPLAEADNRRILVCNCATDSPQWDDWQAIIAPFVIEAAGRGHIYGRHAYADKIGGLDYLVKDGLPLTGAARPFKELDYFRSLGYRIPTVLGELGFYSFPGMSHFISQIGQYDGLMQAYDELGGGCLFTFGEWGDANIESASLALADYLRERLYIMWMPEFVGPEQPPPAKHKAIVVKLPQDVNKVEWLSAAGMAFEFRHTQTASHDDMMTILHGGNADSFVKAAHPERDADALALVEAAGYRWEPLYIDLGFEIIYIAQQLPTHPALEYEQRPLEAITTLTIHHTVSPPDRSIESIAAYHVNSNGWPGIGYHFVIKDTGAIFQTNDLTTKSYHAGSYAAPGDENLFSVGIALQGDFTNSPPPQAQQDAAKWLVEKLKKDLPNITAVLGHRQMPGAQTQCPGNTWALWLPYVAGGEVEQPAPPTGETIPIRGYFEPQGDYGPYKVLSWLDGTKTQPQQLLRRETGILEAKGEGEWFNGKRYDHYERWTFISGGMRRYEDTSAGNLEAYTQHGAMWLPESVVIGKQYINSPRVTKYSLVDCKLISDDVTTDYLTVTKRHDKWQALNGIVVDDVIEIEWRKSPTGPVIERYFYGGNGMGLVGWGVGELQAALSELPQGRTPLNPQLWDCGQ